MTAPLFQTDFTLTRADALAWETLPRELSPRQKLAMFSFVAACGALYAATEEALPVWFLLLPSLVQFLAITLAAFGVWRLGMIAAAHLRAARRLPRPLPCRFEDHGDHVLVRQGATQIVLAPESLLAVTTGPAHVFLVAEDGPLILPFRAFPDPDTARASAGLWQSRVDLAAATD